MGELQITSDKSSYVKIINIKIRKNSFLNMMNAFAELEANLLGNCTKKDSHYMGKKI